MNPFSLLRPSFCSPLLSLSLSFSLFVRFFVRPSLTVASRRKKQPELGSRISPGFIWGSVTREESSRSAVPTNDSLPALSVHCEPFFRDLDRESVWFVNECTRLTQDSEISHICDFHRD